MPVASGLTPTTGPFLTVGTTIRSGVQTGVATRAAGLFAVWRTVSVLLILAGWAANLRGQRIVSRTGTCHLRASRPKRWTGWACPALPPLVVRCLRAAAGLRALGRGEGALR